VETIHQNQVHAFTGLFPGDYFIHEFDFGGQSFFAYGLLQRIEDGKYYADYQSSRPPSQPTTVEKESHRVVGRISRRAYELARLRGWPNSQTGVSAVTDYSAGKRIQLSFRERFRLLFVR
jgi:hypothetical protein